VVEALDGGEGECSTTGRRWKEDIVWTGEMKGKWKKKDLI
jgi:hypothetical protein